MKWIKKENLPFLLFSTVFWFWCIADFQWNGKFTLPAVHMNQTFKNKYSYLQILKWHAAAEYFVMQQFQEDYLMSCKSIGNFQGFYERVISLKQMGQKSVATRSGWWGAWHSVLDNMP